MKGTANIDAWNSLPMAERAAMIRVAVGNGITNLQDIRDKYNEFAWGGPSEAAKKRIEKWEGKAMTGAKDPLSGKYARNSSFEDEAKRFYSVLPKNIREQVLSNPELADNLYSYSYNVGAGNFKKRVVPALQRYYAGKGSVEDIQRSMWASGDTKLRGLQRRRAVERAGVGRALLGGDTPIPTFYTETIPTGDGDFIPFKPMIPEVFGAEQPIEAPVTIEDIPPTIQKPEEPVYSLEDIERQERAESLANLSRIFSLMNGTSENNGMLGALNLLTGNYAEGGSIHIKPSHRGRLTELKERTGKTEAELYNDGNPAHKKMVVFARNSRKWKHGLGGYLYPNGGYVREVNGHPIAFDAEGNLVDQVTGEKGYMQVPEVTIRPTYLDLDTYYPLLSDFVPGHSVLRGKKLNGSGESFRIDKRPHNAGYNFVTNNCSDATREALEAATGNKLNPYLFTTPGDVQDFFKEQYPDFKVVKEGPRTILRAYVTPAEFDRAKTVSDSLRNANAEKRRKEAIERQEKMRAKLRAKLIEHGIHPNRDNLFELGGPTRGRMPAHPSTKNKDKDPEAWKKAQEFQAEMEQRRQQNEEEARKRRLQKADEHDRKAERYKSYYGSVMSTLSDPSNISPFTGSAIKEAAEQQRQEKLDKAHDIKKGVDATVTAAELISAGYGAARGATHLGRYMAQRAVNRAGMNATTSQLSNLNRWNNMTAAVDAPQIWMNGIGGTADGYQWITADNSLDAWENGLETGANVAGVVGGTNWFRNIPALQSIGGNKIDAVLDGLGYSAAAWDMVKNLPPLSTYLEIGRENSRKKYLGSNLYPDGGYVRENGSPISFDPVTGDLIDQTTGQIGTLMLPGIKVTARDPRKPVPTAFDKHEEWLRPMMDFVPGVGDALQAKDAVEDVKNGNYFSAGLNAGMLLLPNAIEKPAKWALRGVSKRSGSQLGDAVLRFIGENPSYRTATGAPMSREGLTQAEEDLLNVFESRGIDTSIFTPEDLQEALNLRRMEVRKSLPSNKRYNYIETNNLGYDISDNIGYDTAGNTMILTGPDNRLHIEMVKNLDPSVYHGVSQRGYDAAIRLAQSTGREGLVSGERLLMPEVTTNVYKNYPNKKKIGDYGVWGPEDATALEGNPVYLLDEPSRIGRVKSDIFDPMIINNRGDMNVLWDKKNLMWGHGGFLKNKKCKQ